jgi:hypothetical protein
MDILCHLHRAESRGVLTYSKTMWSRVLRCSEGELSMVLDELFKANVAECVTECNGDVTLSSRRMVREQITKENGRLRVANHRAKTLCNGDVTGYISEVISHKSETKENKSALRATLTDEEFYQALKSNPAYSHINFQVEDGKMDAWLLLPKNRHRKKTRQFILNWINKIDRPVNTNTGIVTQGCQERVRRGNFLKPCAAPSVTVVKGRPLCQAHKEDYDKRNQ